MSDLNTEEIKEQARELAQALKAAELHINIVEENLKACVRCLTHVQNGLNRIYDRKTIDEIQD